MRKQLVKPIISILFIILTAMSCDDNIEVPKPQNIEIPNGTMVSISAAKAGLDRAENNSITFTSDQFLEAYVVSSDKGGNFFKELILQDKPENPTAGIHFLIDERALHNRFPFGSKLFVQLNGLSVGFGNGVVKLGKLLENEIVALTAFEIDQHVFRTNEIATIQPLNVTLQTLTREKESLLVRLSNMQFNPELLGDTPKTLAAESTDNFDGLRLMKNCDEGIEVALCTSTFASFKTLTLASGSGDVMGVLSRDFRDDFFVLKMNTASDLSFNENTRCDPTFFECTNTSIDATDLLFSEDFETITNENLLEPLGWLNINVTGDEERWTDKKITNVANRVLTISAFNSNLRPLEAWLVTPEVDLTNVEDAFVQFRVRTQFNNGKILHVWITNNFSGEVKTTEWELLPVQIPVASSNYNTLKQPISCLPGKVRIAFQYKGFDPTATATYQIDDVKFYGNIKFP
ncbi:DUF5689 domain-containing protein [Aquimarina agarivorans]|uniref:DUF5689 domain-containing protein n=1 Tax=Aquimarina agarivorans TaxID=980584 RepID=UPI000248E703|nr:DUF5689 domain-containing protein [Aquimarina agarivorans]